MANFNIPENPEFTKEIRKFETTDPGHADVFNTQIEKLFGNELCLLNMLGGNSITVLTRAEYDAIPEADIDPMTIYFIAAEE